MNEELNTLNNEPRGKIEVVEQPAIQTNGESAFGTLLIQSSVSHDLAGTVSIPARFQEQSRNRVPNRGLW